MQNAMKSRAVVVHRRGPRRRPIFRRNFNMLRVITLNLNGIRSAVAKGFLAWLARQKADCVCMQEIKAHRTDLPNAILMPGIARGALRLRAQEGLQRRRHVLPLARPTPIRHRLRQPRVRSRGTAPARRLRQAVGRLDVPAFGLELRGAPAGEVPLPATSSCRCSGSLGAERPRVHPVRRLEHRAPGDRPEELALQPEELRVSCPRSARGSARCSRRPAGSTCSGASTRGPSSTPGGRTAARPGRRTSGGASTTRSPRPGSRRRR